MEQSVFVNLMRRIANKMGPSRRRALFLLYQVTCRSPVILTFALQNMTPSPYDNRIPPQEFAFPFESDCIDDCPEWLAQFSGLSLIEVSNVLAKRWRGVTGPGKALASWMVERIPVSVVSFQWSPIAISLKVPVSEHHRLFIRDVEEIPISSGISEHVRHLLNPFLDIGEGTSMSPAGGFRGAESIEFVNVSSDTHLWTCTSLEWAGAIVFYDTPCGNQLLLNAQGQIGKWDHEDASTRQVFGSFEEFAEEYMSNYTVGWSRDSPLYE